MSPESGRTWWVTGAAGFLGSHVVEQLLEAGEKVCALDNLSTGKREFLEPFKGKPGFRFHVQDLRDTAALTELARTDRPWAVIHLAALHFIPAAVADPALTVSLNVLGTQSVLQACRAAAVERFWFASTGDVYAPSDSAHAEDGRLEPFNIYGLSKLQCEQLIQLESRSRPATRFVIGRLFNLYGPRETNPHILPEILAQLKAGPQTVLRLGSLWPKRDLVPVAEAARAAIQLCLKAPEGVTTLNVATGVAVSMDEVLRAIGELRGSPLTIETDPAKVRPVERAHLQADVRKLKALLGWTPHSRLQEGLTQLLLHEGFPVQRPQRS